MLSLGVTLPLPSLELAKSVYKILKAPDFHDLDNLGDPDKDVAISCSLKAEVILPDRKHAKLWSVMRHKEYADKAPLLKVVI
jgi:hypothetical protein